MWIAWIVVLSMLGYGSSSSSSSSSFDRHESMYRQFPPTIFAPNGRLYNVEESSEKASDSNDLSSNSIIALTCQEGTVLVASPTRSPHFYYNTQLEKEENGDNDNNDDDDCEETIIPLGRMDTTEEDSQQQQQQQALSLLSMISSNVILGAAGNAMDSSVLLDRMERMALTELANDSSAVFGSSSNKMNVFRLARTIADRRQWSTQSVSSRVGRILASSAVIVSRDSLWRIDPTGQFYTCHAAIIGRGAGAMEHWLQSYIQDKLCIDDNDDDDDDETILLESNHVQSYLSSLSTTEALTLAQKCFQQCLEENIIPSLCGILIPKHQQQPMKLLTSSTLLQSQSQ